MVVFILRRLAALPLVLLALTLIIVGLMQFLTPQQRARAFVKSEGESRNFDRLLPRIIRDYGLDQPFPVQYWAWLRGALRGELGFSRTSNKPVLTTLRERFPATLELTLYAALPVLAFGIWLGTLAAVHHNRLPDQIIRFLVVIAYNVPVFVLAVLALVVFYGYLGIAPGPGQLSPESQVKLIVEPVPKITGMLTFDALLTGRLDIWLDALHHLMLPVFTLSVLVAASLTKVMRGSLLEELSQDYVRTARAKGLSERQVILGHARRNALLPVATLGGFIVLGLLGGSLFVESIFAWPGIGQWGANAAVRLDLPGILGYALFTAGLTVIANLLVDILYASLDPRVRFD